MGSLYKEIMSILIESADMKNSIGLLTFDEVVSKLNQRNVYHGSTAYDFSLADVNKVNLTELSARAHIPNLGSVDCSLYKPLSGEDRPIIITLGKGGTIYDRMAGVIDSDDNLIYVDNRLKRGIDVDFSGKGGIYKRFNPTKRVKYKYQLGVDDFFDGRQSIKKDYPNILQRTKIKGENFTFRSGRGGDIIITNEEGYKVAFSGDEWGAHLIYVVREYRGYGLSQKLYDFYLEMHPDRDSGGFTAAGLAGMRRAWERQVARLLASGYYKTALRDGLITKEKLKSILDDYNKTSRRKSSDLSTLGQIKPAKKEAKGAVRIWSDGVTFVVYDDLFFNEKDDKYIYAYGFLRDSEHVGMFVYTLDYERAYRKLAHAIIFEMARLYKEKLYINPEKYGDMLELDGLDLDIKVEGDYAWAQSELFPLREAVKLEKSARHPDPYEEKLNALLEAAESKW